jgi:hypothetical protein
MLDVIFIAATVFFFVVSAAYIAACRGLGGGDL